MNPRYIGENYLVFPYGAPDMFSKYVESDGTRVCNSTLIAKGNAGGLFAVADGAQVSIKAIEHGAKSSDSGGGSTVDLDVRVAGGLYSIEVPVFPPQCTSNADCNPPAWGTCTADKYCLYNYCKSAGARCKSPPPISCTLGGDCTSTTINCAPPGVFAVADNGWSVDVLSLTESGGKKQVAVKVHSNTGASGYTLISEGEDMWFKDCDDPKINCKMTPIVATDAKNQKAKVSVWVKEVTATPPTESVTLVQGCY